MCKVRIFSIGKCFEFLELDRAGLDNCIVWTWSVGTLVVVTLMLFSLAKFDEGSKNEV